MCSLLFLLQVVRHYDLKSAEGAQYLRELEKGKYADDYGDVYVDHEVVRDGVEVFLVSNKRVMYIVYHHVLGNWSVDWEFLHKDLSPELPPTVEKPQSEDQLPSTWW